MRSWLLKPFSHISCLPVLRYFSLKEALAMIGEKLCVELNHYLSHPGCTQLSAEQKDSLKGQVSATMQPDNKVRKLMGKKSDIHCIKLSLKVCKTC